MWITGLDKTNKLRKINALFEMNKSMIGNKHSKRTTAKKKKKTISRGLFISIDIKLLIAWRKV